MRGLDPKIIKSSPVAKAALDNVLQSEYGTKTYIGLVKKYDLKSETPRLLQLALDKPDQDVATEAIRLVYNFKNESAINNIVKGKDEQKAVKLLTAFSKVGYEQTNNIYKDVLLSKNYPDTVRRTAAYMMGRTWMGEDFVMKLVQANKIPEAYMPNVLAGLEYGPRRSMLLKIQDIISESKGGNTSKVLFSIDSVMALKGNVARGGEVFKKNCAICHQVKGEGIDFGPKLTEIGSKLPKDGMLEAIMNPSAGVSFGYETTELQMKDGNTMTGLVASKTEDEISLKMPGGTINKVNRSDIKLMKQSTESMMPALHETMPKQDLADLLEYLSTLQKK